MYLITPCLHTNGLGTFITTTSTLAVGREWSPRSRKRIGRIQKKIFLPANLRQKNNNWGFKERFVATSVDLVQTPIYGKIYLKLRR
jgi:hypothetical protein